VSVFVLAIYIFQWYLTGMTFFLFDRSVLRTNFYQPTKVALSFRMEPGFLPEVEYPKKPFGMFFVIGPL